MGSVARPQAPQEPMVEPSPQQTQLPDGVVDVVISKDRAGGNGRFGFANVPAADGRSLLISWIDQNGLLGLWNTEHQTMPIREGDNVLSVNGVTQDVEAMRVQLQASTVRMAIRMNSASQNSPRFARA